MAEKRTPPAESTATDAPPPARSARPVRQGFIGKVVEDPAAPPTVWLMSGYLGDSAREDHVRLYLSPDLSLWLDIPQEAIIHTERLPSEANYLGAVLAWVRRDAHVVPGYAGQPTR